VLSLTSAALHHGWPVKTVPDEPHITVRRRRKIPPEKRCSVKLHYYDLLPEDIADGIATSKELTLLQCLRQLPFDDALAVADSALRDGEQAMLRRVSRSARGPRSPQVRRVAEAARSEAANPFESVLRAIALDVRGLNVEPQQLVTSTTPWVRPDLVDRDLKIAIEADSFEWHGGREALTRDARRYNLLVADGWLVLRFAWEQVMFDPAYVHGVLAAVVQRRAEVRCADCAAA
jgi:very-short-patch-repair endonuclease